LQKYVSREENSESQSEYPIVKTEIARHPDRSVSHARPVQKINDVQQKQKRKQPYSDLLSGLFGLRSVQQVLLLIRN
jgi:hypothetical protein